MLSSASATAAARQQEVKAKKVRRLISFPEPKPFYINRLPLLNSLPPETKRWIRDASDERAAIEYGCRYNEARGQYAVDWIESNCVLYEGHAAGQHMSAEDWQYELYMQLFGWLYFSDEWAARLADESMGWIRRYVECNGWVPKKNTKSPTLAAAGLYCLIADGELGQKCYSVALDKKQAEISHAHAINFVRANPSLASYCQVHETTKEITDHRTKSKYSIKAGATAGNRDRNEGLNGLLFVDEIHVVNEHQMAILSRAGISRRQRLILQLSTAGTNLSGYGYKKYLEGQDNIKAAERGADFNFRLKHLEFSVPRETSLDDLRDKTKIEDYIRMANPTLGRIIVKDEILQDWRQSVVSDTKLIEFAMYRLGLWSASGGVYIAESDWNKCIVPFKFKDVGHFPAGIGCDFAAKRDMCCIMLGLAVPKTVSMQQDPFDEDSEWVDREINIPHIQPYFFLPRKAVDRYKRQINFDEFEAKKLLTIVDGAAIRPEYIAAFINKLSERFDVRKVGSDAYYSTDVATCLETNHSWDIKGEHTRYQLIGQTASTVGPAVEQLQNCVLNQQIAHRGNDMMRWQLGNLTLIEDTNQNRRFEKPTADNYRKIDGWQALVHLIFCMMSDPELYPGQVLSIKA